MHMPVLSLLKFYLKLKNKKQAMVVSYVYQKMVTTALSAVQAAELFAPLLQHGNILKNFQECLVQLAPTQDCVVVIVTLYSFVNMNPNQFACFYRTARMIEIFMVVS